MHINYFNGITKIISFSINRVILKNNLSRYIQAGKFNSKPLKLQICAFILQLTT